MSTEITEEVMTKRNFMHIEGIGEIIYTVASTFLPPVGSVLEFKVDESLNRYKVERITFEGELYPISDTLLAGDPTITISEEHSLVPTLHVRELS